MAQYLFRIGNYTPSAWELKGLAVGCITFIVLCRLRCLLYSYNRANGDQ